ncbi:MULTISPECIES: adenosine deaminase [Streptomycetaceae]|uniref:Adenosine deaminase n=1 Tax=Streptantibioticus cattleyicolor (strain ATCC 35852 / DSM 46488 / JCM 4925 / NBRC 14057 / NRRL 8057) TaxID=1003195 RepID=F8JYC3_STREN|nr:MULTISPECIES: adenosine deaminase [Streptomycetaceae]AEW95917.1 adenosine deaminase [Streptantibioticus cattleyicolor NRRL 8057 = DSM 46488]MYS60454.1 adenosine deaminase [Streptomyces sp. SID5468]CCB76253.1 Adenosine deaminase [Streptantibioticus cattleyicolor NRRL 8057 = DSM 46488]
MARDVHLLPKAHLHLHFTGSMRTSTLLELAETYGVHLPEALTSGEPPKLRATDERGWFRFQRLYDIARSVLRTPEDIRRLVREAAEEEVEDGSGWLEIQVDPTSYAPRLGGLIPALEIILDAVDEASRLTGVGMAVVVAANRTRHPLDARTLARLAVRYADRGVVGFGLSNDERRGLARDFDRAFAIARDGGLLAAPHGGELAGPGSVRDCLDDLHAARVGHGVRAAEDPALLARLAEQRITCEVCPASNVALGVYEKPEDVPLRTLFEAGVPMALGADDPLLFGSRLAAQYELARQAHGFSDEELAELARQSVRGSRAPEPVRRRLLAGIDDWLAS